MQPNVPPSHPSDDDDAGAFAPPTPPSPGQRRVASPSAGWYPDPQNLSGPRRWWDGTNWTEAREFISPTALPPSAIVTAQPASQQQPFPPLRDVLKYGASSLKALWRPLLVIAASTIGVTTAVGMAWSIAGVTGVGSEAANDSVRAGGELAIFLVSFAAALWSMYGYLASSWLVLDHHDALVGHGSSSEATLNVVDARRALSRSRPIFVRYFGWWLAVVAPLIIGLTAIGVPVQLWLADHTTNLVVWPIPMIAVVLMMLLLAAIVVGAWLSVRWLAFLDFSIIDWVNAPFGRASNVSRGRFFATLGYLVVLGPIVGGGAIAIRLPGRLIQMSIQTTASSGAATAVIVGAIIGVAVGCAAVVGFVLATGFGGSCLALLYRTANPPIASRPVTDSPIATPTVGTHPGPPEPSWVSGAEARGAGSA